MKKIIRNLSTIISMLFLILCCEVFCFYKTGKPIFIIDEEIKGLNKIYKGIFYDAYNCAEYSAPQLKLKWNKYSCPLNEEIKNIEKTTTEVKITLVGDLLFEQPFYDAIDNGYDKEEYFSLVKNYFENDDISIGNMEVVIGNDSLKSSGVGYNFCAPQYIGDLVNTLDFEILSTANNHAYDRGIEGINSTLDYFNSTDIKTVGTYKSIEDRENFRILNINDIKFGFLSYTYGTNQKPNENDVNLIGYYKNPYSKELTKKYKNKIKKEIENLKKKSDVVIILMHWGTEFTYTPGNEQKEMANYLNELGVDIIVGSHSHNIQPIEIIGDEHKTLVYYSLGNFVSADDDIARTSKGEETFDNAYQVGLLSNLIVEKENDKINFKEIKTELIVNYFDDNMSNFKLIPFDIYSDKDEKSHYRYKLGLTKNFINEMYENVIDKNYR